MLGHAVLHHLPNLRRAFAEFHRVLRPGGRIVFAGEPSRLGDRIAAVPKRGAGALAPRGGDCCAPSPAPRRRGPPRPRPSTATTTSSSASSTSTRSTPGDLSAPRRRAGLPDVRSAARSWPPTGSAGSTAALEATADPDDVPMLWRQYAFHGYLVLQRLDERVLEPLLPPAIFYNLLLTARRDLSTGAAAHAAP